MRTILFSFLFFFLQSICFSQTIEGDRLLDLVGKPVSDQLFTDLKAQETFYTNAWDQNFTIYINVSSDVIKEVELQNGKLKYGSKTERYGYYTKTLPLKLRWSMSAEDFETMMGKPVLVSQSMNFKDYKAGNWQVRIFFENNKPVSISFTKINAEVGKPPVAAPSVTNQQVTTQPLQTNWLIKLDTTTIKTVVNWPALKNLIISTTNLKPFTGNDSVDYIGQVYYTTPYKAIGFERTAIKRRKQAATWHYEAFLKTSTDSNKVRNIFFSLYDELKKTIKDNTGDDFILASSARMPISDKTVSWLAQWTLYSGYKGLVPGLGKVKVALLLQGSVNVFKEGQMDYTLKIFVFDKDTSIDFFTWDTPRN